jgi:hypothetical protein
MARLMWEDASMLTRIWGRLLVTISSLLLIVSSGFGQVGGSLPPAPVPVLPSTSPSVPILRVPPSPQPPPPPLPPPPPEGFYPVDDFARSSVSPATGIPSFGDDYLPPPGWFANIDLAVVAPVFKNQIKGDVLLPGKIVSTVAVPGTDLDWTFSPKIEVGYRFPLDLGSVLVGYRSMVSEGEETEADTLGNFGTLKSRLNFNQIDVDYRSMDFDVGGKWNLFWRLGARVATIYYDSAIDSNLITTLSGPGSYQARVSNNFVGVGPKAALEFNHCFTPKLSLYTNCEGAVLIGHVNQSYGETYDFPAVGGPFGGARDDSTTQAVPMLGINAGLRWTPVGPDILMFSLGYQYEYWWMLGRLGGANASNGDLESQGVYFRGQFRF